jgi:hypothetical protein
MTMTPRTKAYLNTLITAFITGGLGSFAVNHLDHDHFAVFTLNFWRTFAAFGVVGVINHVRNSPLPNFFSLNMPELATTEEPEPTYDDGDRDGHIDIGINDGGKEEGDLHQ